MDYPRLHSVVHFHVLHSASSLQLLMKCLCLLWVDYKLQLVDRPPNHFFIGIPRHL